MTVTSSELRHRFLSRLTRPPRSPILRRMDVQAILVIAAILIGVCVLTLRSEPRRRRTILLLVPLPAAALLLRWAAYRRAWPELAAAAGLAAAGVLLWWLVLGRRLPPASNSPIRVWNNKEERYEPPDDPARPG